MSINKKRAALLKLKHVAKWRYWRPVVSAILCQLCQQLDAMVGDDSNGSPLRALSWPPSTTNRGRRRAFSLPSERGQ